MFLLICSNLNYVLVTFSKVWLQQKRFHLHLSIHYILIHTPSSLMVLYRVDIFFFTAYNQSHMF